MEIPDRVLNKMYQNSAILVEENRRPGHGQGN